MGGSGGEDRFTTNITLSSRKTTLMTQQYPALEAESFRDYFPKKHGVMVHSELPRGKKIKNSYIKEWGKQSTWSKDTHFSFPTEFKTVVKTTLLVHKSKQNQEFSKVPKVCLEKIFDSLSQHYMPKDPMESILRYPGRSVIPDDQNNLY